MKRILMFRGVIALLAGLCIYAANAYGVGVNFTTGVPGSDINITRLLGELVKNTTTLDKDVKNNSSILVSQWNMQQKAKAAASAQLLPSGLPFLWENSGYQYMIGLAQQSDNNQQQIMQIIAPQQCQAGQTSSVGCQQTIDSDPATGILIPQTITQAPPASSGSANAYGYGGGGGANLDSNSQEAAMQEQLLQLLKTLPQSYAHRLMGEQDTLTTYALAQVMAGNLKIQGTSINGQLKKAIMQPFSTDNLSKTGKSWFQSLASASTPQLLRMIAVQLAVQNYLAYQQYRLAQTQQLIHLNNISKLVSIQKALGNLQNNNNNNTDKITTAIYQLDRDVQKMGHNR